MRIIKNIFWALGFCLFAFFIVLMVNLLYIEHVISKDLEVNLKNAELVMDYAYKDYINKLNCVQRYSCNIDGVNGYKLKMSNETSLRGVSPNDSDMKTIWLGFQNYKIVEKDNKKYLMVGFGNINSYCDVVKSNIERIRKYDFDDVKISGGKCLSLLPEMAGESVYQEIEFYRQISKNDIKK